MFEEAYLVYHYSHYHVSSLPYLSTCIEVCYCNMHWQIIILIRYLPDMNSLLKVLELKYCYFISSIFFQNMLLSIQKYDIIVVLDISYILQGCNKFNRYCVLKIYRQVANYSKITQSIILFSGVIRVIARYRNNDGHTVIC